MAICLQHWWLQCIASKNVENSAASSFSCIRFVTPPKPWFVVMLWCYLQIVVMEISLQFHRYICCDIGQAYDLAKKKGYLVVCVLSRRYPLVNTYRNFCDASNRPCIFIEQVLVSEILIFQLGLWAWTNRDCVWKSLFCTCLHPLLSW